MTLTAQSLGFTTATFEEFLVSRREPTWVTDMRKSAWKSFTEKEWPNRREEEWIRTDIRLFNVDKFAAPTEATAGGELPKALLSNGVKLGGSTSALNSRPMESRLDAKWAAKGVVFGSLEEILAEHGDRLRPFVEKRIVNVNYDKFSALHGAFWSGGHVLYVPRGVAVNEPMHFFSAMSNGGVDLCHTLVVLDEGAEATVLAETLSSHHEDQGFHCGATELSVGNGARLRFVNLQDWGHNVWHFAHQQANVGRTMLLCSGRIAALGSRLSKVNQQVALIGKGAETQVNGVLFTEGKQHIAYHTLQHHIADHCRSDFLYKAALQDKSRTVWRGMIKVDKNAQKTDGYQRNDNLLLSTNARADSIPGLEIEADDVRCTHGSTTGKVDEELIFYAQCRGFTRKEAVRLIVTGFFQQIFDRITIDSVRDALAGAIARRVREYQ